MNTEYANRSCLVWDNGLFTHVALKLAESFGRVLYGGYNVNGFPKSNASLAGKGLDGIERVDEFWKHAHDVDLIVFPDVGYMDLQAECIRQGMRVWGASEGEKLEQDRWFLKKLLRDLGMPVAESYRITGMDELRKFIQESPDFWVKTSRFRGDFETFHAVDYDYVKPKLDEVESCLGTKSRTYPFIVEADIPAILEIGYDGFTIDGQFPQEQAIFGIEEKDLGYMGVVKPYVQLPKEVKWVNQMLSDVLRETRYRGFFSTEIRVTDDGKAYLTDPCCRAGSPPSELYIEWFENWDDIIWNGAEGMVVEPKPIAKYGVEVMLHSAWADRHWQPVDLPSSGLKYVKLRNCCCIDGVYASVPQEVGLPEIGAVIGFGDSMEDAIGECIKHTSEVKGYYLESKIDAISSLVAKIHNAQEEGLEFTDDPMPTAQSLEDLQLTADA